MAFGSSAACGDTGVAGVSTLTSKTPPFLFIRIIWGNRTRGNRGNQLCPMDPILSRKKIEEKWEKLNTLPFQSKALLHSIHLSRRTNSMQHSTNLFLRSGYHPFPSSSSTGSYANQSKPLPWRKPSSLLLPIISFPSISLKNVWLVICPPLSTKHFWGTTHIGFFASLPIPYGFTWSNHVLFMVIAVFDAKVMIESEANILPFRWQQIVYADDSYHPYDPYHR